MKTIALMDVATGRIISDVQMAVFNAELDRMTNNVVWVLQQTIEMKANAPSDWAAPTFFVDGEPVCMMNKASVQKGDVFKLQPPVDSQLDPRGYQQGWRDGYAKGVNERS